MAFSKPSGTPHLLIIEREFGERRRSRVFDDRRRGLFGFDVRAVVEQPQQVGRRIGIGQRFVLGHQA